MGHRLTQIATRTGDEGTTGLGNNQRVSKNSLRVHAMGDVDELNSHIGLLLCEKMPEDVRDLLVEVQHQLFNLGGELSIPGFELLKAEAVLVFWFWIRPWTHTTRSCPSWKSSFCRPATVQRPKRTFAERWPGVLSGQPWLWAMKRRSMMRPVNT